MKKIGPHTLRRAFITAAVDAGVPLRDVQEAASHADPRTTMRYDRARVSLDRHATYSGSANRRAAGGRDKIGSLSRSAPILPPRIGHRPRDCRRLGSGDSSDLGKLSWS